MAELALIFVVLFLVSLAAVVTYRRTPFLSKSWRIKVVPVDDYKDHGVQILFVRRFSSGGMSYTRHEFTTVKYGPNFDTELAEQLALARARLRTLRSTARLAKRLDRH